MRSRQRISQIVLERAGFQCENCGRDKHLTVDHILPKSAGGNGELGNLQILCRPCHKIKTIAWTVNLKTIPRGTLQ